MAISPYEIARPSLGLLESQLKTAQAVETGKKELGVQKGKMRKEFEEELAAAQRAAEVELRKKHKKSKRSKWSGALSALSGFIPGWGPILGSLLGAYTSGDVMRGAGKHAEKQAKLARAEALGISDKWKGTFLGSGARDYESKASSYYDDLISKADVSRGDILSSALTSGLTSFATGKLIGKGMEGLKGLKGLKEFGITDLPEGASPSDVSKLLEKVSELEVPSQAITASSGQVAQTPLKGASRLKQLKYAYPDITSQMSDEYLKNIIKTGVPEQFAKTSVQVGGGGGYNLEKILGAKAPRLNVLAQSAGIGIPEIGKKLGGEDLLQGLLLLLATGQSLTDIYE